MSYLIETLDAKEFATLSWLSDRGYDANILYLTEGELDDQGNYIFKPIPEAIAWEIREAIESDSHAFLACNGSKSLSDKLYKFINSIV